MKSYFLFSAVFVAMGCNGDVFERENSSNGGNIAQSSVDSDDADAVLQDNILACLKQDTKDWDEKQSKCVDKKPSLDDNGDDDTRESDDGDRGNNAETNVPPPPKIFCIRVSCSTSAFW